MLVIGTGVVHYMYIHEYIPWFKRKQRMQRPVVLRSEFFSRGTLRRIQQVREMWYISFLLVRVAKTRMRDPLVLM